MVILHQDRVSSVQHPSKQFNFIDRYLSFPMLSASTNLITCPTNEQTPKFLFIMIFIVNR